MIGRRPELFERAVMFDIGLITPKLLPKLSWLVIGLYQWWLALAFVVSQVLPIVGTLVGDVMLGVFPWRLVGPCPHDAKVGIPRPWREVHSWMCYPYLHIWRDILLDFRGTKKTQVFPPSVGVPTLFMYGEKKRTMYHTPDFLEKLDADEKSRWRFAAARPLALRAGHGAVRGRDARVSAGLSLFEPPRAHRRRAEPTEERPSRSPSAAVA